MHTVILPIDPYVYDFYASLGQQVGLSTEQVMADALFKLAGELSIQALKKMQIQD